MKKSLLLSALFVLVITSSSLAHAIRLQIEEHPPAVKVWAGFSATTPLIDVKVEVIDPDGQTLFQSGRTDRQGQFAFLPNAAGEWTLKIDDERGHRQSARIQISENFFGIEPDEETAERAEKIQEKAEIVQQESDHHHHDHHHHIPLVYKIIFGLAVIFGITGIFYGLKARKK